MSENLKRGNPDFSKYDSMSIGELEEILRADAQGPERDDSDVDEILYVMEVLAKKRRQNGIAGKTALEAYQEFQQHYLPILKEEEGKESFPKSKSTIIQFRRIATVAASLVLVFTLTTSANAFGWKDIWNAVARWAEETFSFSMGMEISDPHKNDGTTYHSLMDALLMDGKDTSIVPTWFPNGYELLEIIVDRNPMQETYIAVYTNDDKRIKITVQSFLSIEPEQIEVSGELVEVYNKSGIDYYIMQNNNITQAAWISKAYECYIAGELCIDDLKLMLDSIGKG